MLPSANDLARQAAWEVEGSRRAEAHYRAAAEKGDIASLPAGQRMLRTIVPPLIKAVKEAQAEAADRIKAGGNPPGWCWPIRLLSADRWAFITVAICLRANEQVGHDRAGIANVCEAIATMGREELDYQRWRTEQAKANKAAKEASDDDHVDLLKALERTYKGTVDRKVWRRWASKVEALQDEPWDKNGVILPFGAKLISMLLDVAPTMFVKEEKSVGHHRTKVVLKLTDKAVKMMEDIHERAAVSRPLRMPMLMRPLAWRYLDN